MATLIREQPRLVWPADPIGRLLAFATAAHARAVALLVLVSLAAFLPGFFQIPPTDRDEARFAQATKQMVETGDFVDIRFQDEVRYKKPVGIYWLQAAAVMAGEALGVPNARTRIWVYRIPSLIGAIGAVLLTYWTALAFAPRRYAFLAGLMLAGSVLLSVEARLAKTDAMLLLTIVAAIGALARAYLGRVVPAQGVASLVLPAIFWTALAAGVLLKGPVILLIVGLTALTLMIHDRSARWFLALRPGLGVLWLVALVSPWTWAILSRAGETFVAESLGRDLLPKLFSGQEGHGAPPGFYFVLFWLTFWPAAPLAALSAPAVWAERWERPTTFLLAWLVPSWIGFELVVTKLPHYVLPLYPAIAILIARSLWHGTLSSSVWLQRLTVGWPIVAALVPIVAVVALVAMRHQLGLLAWPFGAVAMVFGFMAWRYYDVDGAEKSLIRGVIASVLIVLVFFGIIAPSLRPLFPSATLARVLASDPCDYKIVAAAGYSEPSLVFLVGTSIRLTDGAGAAEVLREGQCRFALIESREQRAFVQRAEVIGLRYAPLPRVDGINISNGRSISVAVYRSAKAP
ncbi:MAG TPA: glycosyltransferase family 39 protein [Xanthobacteraceae bacterium]|nr:glycosyltransferase family 39 protein [Xanthobacteraceae bacterium]